MGECEYNVVSFRRSECWHMHNHTMCVRQRPKEHRLFSVMRTAQLMIRDATRIPKEKYNARQVETPPITL